MTVRRIQTFNLPFFGEVVINSIVKPGFRETVRYEELDEEGRDVLKGKLKIDVPDEDHAIRDWYGIVSKYHPSESFDSVPTRYEKEQIGSLMIDRHWQGKATGRFGQDIRYDWEPTLPPQARK